MSIRYEKSEFPIKLSDIEGSLKHAVGAQLFPSHQRSRVQHQLILRVGDRVGGQFQPENRLLCDVRGKKSQESTYDVSLCKSKSLRKLWIYFYRFKPYIATMIRIEMLKRRCRRHACPPNIGLYARVDNGIF